jgi:peroxiredoxin
MSIRKIRGAQFAAYLLTVFLAIDVVLLTIENRKLKESLESKSNIKIRTPLQTGDIVESIKLQTLEGKTTELVYSKLNQKHLFFVLSTTCPHCLNNLHKWGTIYSKKYSNECDIMGIAIDNLERIRDYVFEKDVSFYVVSVAIDTSFSRKYKITGVPETILIKGNGEVEKVWMGELTNEQTDEIIRLLDA